MALSRALGCLLLAALLNVTSGDYVTSGVTDENNDARIYGDPTRGSPQPDFGNSASYNNDANYDPDHTLVGNAPDGMWVTTTDATCPGTGQRDNRMFYGSSVSHNSVQASDPTAGCDNSSEQGDSLPGGLIEYYWTADVNGNACGDMGLGSITTPDTRSLGADDVDLFICAKTHHWGDYELAVYQSDHPLYAASIAGITFVRPANIKKTNYNWLVGVQNLQTWGCEWIETSTQFCYDSAAQNSLLADANGLVRCNEDCYNEFGCGSDGTSTEWKRLTLKEMVVEIELDPQGTHPPDIYLWKPMANEPEGLPSSTWGVEAGVTPEPWIVDSAVESRFSTMISGNFPPSLKETLMSLPAGGLEQNGDVLISLSTDNFGPEAVAEITQPQTFVLFDDHASTPVNGVTGWASGAYSPEDKLEAFKFRTTYAGSGTWVLVTVDDCDAPEGTGAEVVTWQIHFVCYQIGFCKQSSPSPSPPPPQGSGSGDPHMVGFKGQKFDYHGLPGEFFNVISTPKTQFNAFLQPELLDGLTYMGSIGVQLEDGSKVQVTALPGSHTLLVEVNDRMVMEDTVDGPLEVVFADAKTVRIVSPEMTVVASLHKEQFIDVKAVELHMKPEAIHGVLGNTANLSEDEEYEGEDEDYFVSHMWASDFKHNVFKSSVERATGKMPGAKRLSRSERKAAFELTDIMAAKMVNIDEDGLP